MLVLALAVLGVAVTAPSLSSTGGVAEATPSRVPIEAPSEPPVPVIRHGLVGRAAGVNPLTATNRAERDLVALVFAGLVRLGSGQSYEPGLAQRWTVSPDGATWTFELRDDARWHDGTPVTAQDVVFTVGLLHDPDYTGPGAASWRDVSATEVDDRTVRFELGAPIAGFLDAARQPLLPSHLLDGVAVAELADHPFNAQPIGAGPYRLVSLGPQAARLEPVDDGAVDARPSASAPLADPLATPPRAAPPVPPDRPALLELRFHPDAQSLVDAWEAGEVDLASGLPPEIAADLGARAGSRLIRYPTTTLSAVLLNQRTGHPELRGAATRRALLKAIDRPSVLDEAWAGLAQVADAPIPPSSWAFDEAASPHIGYDRRAAAAELDAAGWTPADGRWTAPGGSKPYVLELLSPDAASNRTGHAAAASVAEDLRRIGLDVTHLPLEPGQLVGDRLRPGRFTAAIVDVNVGLDPDVYPLLASSQTRSSGLNLGGVVDPELDRLLAAARAPGSVTARLEAYRTLQERLATHQYVLPLAFRDEPVVVRDAVFGISPRLIGDAGDRFWDVLAWRLAAGR